MADARPSGPEGVTKLALQLALAPWSIVGRLTPVPAAMAVRGLFLLGGARTAAALERGAPKVEVRRDLRYGPGRADRLDAYLPPDAGDGPHPVVVWVHGGGFVGGAKEELSGYLRRLADAGHVVVAPRYGLAPGTRYPVALRQLAAAIDHAVSPATELGADRTRVVLAGDSAGAHLVAQLASLIVAPERAEELDLDVPLPAEALRGLVLCCGVFDLASLADAGLLAPFTGAVGWAYSGRRDFHRDEAFVRQTTIAPLVDRRFPPTFLTVGDADPLRPHSEALATALARARVPVTTAFHSPTDGPGLGHEYQFELARPEAQHALDRLLAFLAERS